MVTSDELVDFAFNLEEGTPLLVRPIRPDDKGLLKRGLEQLSPASRYRRFFRTIDELSDAELRYLTEVDFVTHGALVCVRADDPSEGVGVARWILLDGSSDVAEAAVTVVDRYHGKGIGKTLLYLLARNAVENGIRAFRSWVLGDNAAILAILKALGASAVEWERGVAEVTIPLPDNVSDLEATAAPLILKRVAGGDFEAELSTRNRHGTAFSTHRDSR